MLLLLKVALVLAVAAEADARARQLEGNCIFWAQGWRGFSSQRCRASGASAPDRLEAENRHRKGSDHLVPEDMSLPRDPSSPNRFCLLLVNPSHLNP